MAFWVEEERRVRPLRVAEVARMRQLGVLGEDDRVELLLGMLVRPGPRTPAHERVVERLTTWLVHAAGAADGAFDVRVRAPLAVPDPTSLPTPDVAVIGDAGAGEALLLVEVAVETIQADAEVKAPMYAAAGVPELWVVEPAERRVHVYERPTAAGYPPARILTGEADLAPAHVRARSLPLARLFRGL